MSAIDLHVNGRTFTTEAEPDTPLLYVLTNDPELNGPRFGCGLAQCGACTVLLRGVAVRSCTIPLSLAQGGEITTLEGLGTLEAPHPIQQAFIDEQAAQCGYCINGVIMTAKAFLDRSPTASDKEIREALDRNLCKCGTHLRILRAIHRYQQEVLS